MSRTKRRKAEDRSGLQMQTVNASGPVRDRDHPPDKEMKERLEAPGIVKDTYYRWMRAGKALHLGQESPDIPYFAPRQPDETDEAFCKRKHLWDWNCALLEDLFLTVTRTIARKRVAWMRRMDQRALQDKDMYANAWVLERTDPEHYALVTTNRKQIDAKVEVTHKQQAQLLAEAFAILGPANPALPAGRHTITKPERDTAVIDGDHD